MNIMADENVVMAEVMNLLEAEPGAACLRLGPTFPLFASSLLFWCHPAGAKNQSARISHTKK